MGGIPPISPGRVIENPEVAVDEIEDAGENRPTKCCQVGEPIGAKSVTPVKPAGETKERVKTGRGFGLGTGDGRVDQ